MIAWLCREKNRRNSLSILCGYVFLFQPSLFAANTNTVFNPAVVITQRLEPLHQFFMQQALPPTLWPPITYLKKTDIPKSYRYLLTQPLMTKAIQHYYQRIPSIRSPLYTDYDKKQKTYSRAIVMIVDRNKKRDDALAADLTGESLVVELGLITMNFHALPTAVINGVCKTRIPFGALLAQNKVKVRSTDVHFFKIECTTVFAKYLRCDSHSSLYGRTNTLIRSDNGQWIAQVVEILNY